MHVIVHLLAMADYQYISLKFQEGNSNGKRLFHCRRQVEGTLVKEFGNTVESDVRGGGHACRRRHHGLWLPPARLLTCLLPPAREWQDAAVWGSCEA